MSETLNSSSHNKLPNVEKHEAKEKLNNIREKLNERAEKLSPSEQKKDQLDARKEVEKLAISGKEVASSNSEKKSSHKTVHRSHKKLTYKATMRRVEANLPVYQRKFSRVINNDKIDKVSNIASKTIARPSGILGAGVVAFTALVIVSFYASKYGWEVSNSTFIVFLAIGWISGSLVEAVYKFIKK